MAHWQAGTKREPPRSKAELRQMLADAVRNTQPSSDQAPKHPVKSKASAVKRAGPMGPAVS